MQFKSVGVIGKPQAAQQSLDTFKILQHLFQQWQIEAYYETEVAQALGLDVEQGCNAIKLAQHCDILLVVGGDGSMLSASRTAVTCNKPVLGINRGHLGFLTDIGPEELESRLYQVLSGDYWIEERFLLTGVVEHTATERETYQALNDIVLSLGSSTHLIEFDIWIDDAFMCRQRADGIIITTPTGSTAYALSAGGPILHPTLNAIALVPMLPHKLTSRPIVVSGNSVVKVRLVNQSDTPAIASFDSHDRIPLTPQESLIIKACSQKIQLVHPKDYDYFKTLRDKLYWESR